MIMSTLEKLCLHLLCDILQLLTELKWKLNLRCTRLSWSAADCTRRPLQKFILHLARIYCLNVKMNKSFISYSSKTLIKNLILWSNLPNINQKFLWRSKPKTRKIRDDSPSDYIKRVWAKISNLLRITSKCEMKMRFLQVQTANLDWKWIFVCRQTAPGHSTNEFCCRKHITRFEIVIKI